MEKQMAYVTLDKSKMYYIGDLTEPQKEKLFKHYNIINDPNYECIVYHNCSGEWLLCINLNELLKPEKVINLAKLLPKESIEDLGFTYDDGYYFKDMGLFEIWVGKEIHVKQDSDVVTLCDYSYERLKKLLEVFEL